eukprot:4244460-Pyramimonas_sp.AAC.1
MTTSVGRLAATTGSSRRPLATTVPSTISSRPEPVIHDSAQSLGVRPGSSASALGRFVAPRSPPSRRRSPPPPPPAF